MDSFCSWEPRHAMSVMRGTHHCSGRRKLTPVVQPLLQVAPVWTHFFLLARWSYLTGIASPNQLPVCWLLIWAGAVEKNGMSARKHKLLLYPCQWFVIPVCFMGKQEILCPLGVGRFHRNLPLFHLPKQNQGVVISLGRKIKSEWCWHENPSDTII